MNNNTDPFVWRPRPSDAPPGAGRSDTDLPLSGMRLAVKDLFHIAGVATAAGNPDWMNSHSIPMRTSPVVGKLLDAGAELVGKTLTDELAYSLNGQNIHYGTPLNAQDPQRIPGGSSSGSTAAVAHDLADIGLGTDTGGSIRVPASYNGLYGLRPTHGLISTEEMVGLAPEFDTVGWLTRDLHSLQKVANILFQNTAQRAPHKQLELISAPQLNAMVTHQDEIDSFLRRHAFTKCDFPSDLLSKASEAFRILQGREIWQLHGDWIKANNPTFASDIAARFKWCATLTNEDQEQASTMAKSINKHVSELLAGNRVFVMPTTPGPAPLLNTSAEDLVVYRNHLLGLTALAGLGGLPQLHIPLKTNDEHSAVAGSESGSSLFGISLLGNKNTDLQLINTAIKLTGGKLSS